MISVQFPRLYISYLIHQVLFWRALVVLTGLRVLVYNPPVPALAHVELFRARAVSKKPAGPASQTERPVKTTSQGGLPAVPTGSPA